MTYWATLWYAGTVVFSMGYEGQTLGECLDLTQLIASDINASYSDQDILIELKQSAFPDNKFTTTCQVDFLKPDELYKE